jgi:hypothetical protein
MNISQIPHCRTVFLQRSNNNDNKNFPILFSFLLPFLHHPDVIVRGGMYFYFLLLLLLLLLLLTFCAFKIRAGLIRNLLIEKDEYCRLLGPFLEDNKSPSFDLLEHLLLPIFNADGEYNETGNINFILLY